jgi:hypothetical protein
VANNPAAPQETRRLARPLALHGAANDLYLPVEAETVAMPVAAATGEEIVVEALPAGIVHLIEPRS